MEETSNSCGFIDLYVVFFPYLVFLREVQYALFIKIVNFVLNNIDLLLRKSKKSIDQNPIPKAKTVKKLGPKKGTCIKKNHTKVCFKHVIIHVQLG